MSDFKVWLDSLVSQYVELSKVREKFNESFSNPKDFDPPKSGTGAVNPKNENLIKNEFESWANKAISIVNGLKEIMPTLMEIDKTVHNISDENKDEFSYEQEIINEYKKLSEDAVEREVIKNIKQADISNLQFGVYRNIFKMGYDSYCEQFPGLNSSGKTKELAINSIKRLVIREILNKK